METPRQTDTASSSEETAFERPPDSDRHAEIRARMGGRTGTETELGVTELVQIANESTDPDGGERPARRRLFHRRSA